MIRKILGKLILGTNLVRATNPKITANNLEKVLEECENEALNDIKKEILECIPKIPRKHILTKEENDGFKMAIDEMKKNIEKLFK